MPEPESPESEQVLLIPGQDDSQEGEQDRESVEHPAKVMRIGSMIKQLLEEVRQAPLDERSRARLREIYDTSVAELAEGLSPDLRSELEKMASPFGPDYIDMRSGASAIVGKDGKIYVVYSGAGAADPNTGSKASAGAFGIAVGS